MYKEKWNLILKKEGIRKKKGFHLSAVLQAYQTTVSVAQILSAVHIPLILFSFPTYFSEFALSICSWNQLTVNLFSGMSVSPGSLPFDWPFSPVVKILPILTDTQQLQFVCFKVLPRVIRKVSFTYLLCGTGTVPGNWFAMWLGTWGEDGKKYLEQSPGSL